MAKYYVESGDLQVVVQASSPIPAAAKALSWVNEHEQLAPQITVNERGFISNRPAGRMPPSGIAVETGTLLALIAEHDFA
jgi:hypothetical protein